MPTQSNITVIDKAPHNNPTLFLGTKYSLTQSNIYDRFGIPQHTWYSITNNLSSGLHGSVQSYWINDQKFFFAMLPQKSSRSNSPSKAWAIPKLVEIIRSESKANIIAFIEEERSTKRAPTSNLGTVWCFSGTVGKWTSCMYMYDVALR